MNPFSLIMREYKAKIEKISPQIERQSKKQLISSLQTGQVMKDKGKLRICHRLETNETW